MISFNDFRKKYYGWLNLQYLSLDKEFQTYTENIFINNKSMNNKDFPTSLVH